MARALWLPDVISDAGCRVSVVEGWQIRGKDSKLAPFRPAGVLEHHTATKRTLSISGLLTLIIRGRIDLPGPLAQLVPDRTGIVYVVASGIANHAGRGHWQGLTSNRVLIGLENANDGRGEPWPTAQLDALEKTTAAICRHLEAPAGNVAGHKEYALPAGRKIDPVGIDMATFRNRVRAALEKGETMILRPGVRGADVKAWQQLLNRAIAKNSIPIPLLDIDGDYGAKTKAAVKAYQRSAGILERIPELGHLDDYTRDLLDRDDD